MMERLPLSSAGGSRKPASHSRRSDSTTAKYEDDTALAKRLSLTTGPTYCYATKSDAPHAPLRPLLTSIVQYKRCLEDKASEDEVIDAGEAAAEVQKWEAKLWSVLRDLNAAEKDRCADVLNAMDWYNDKLLTNKKTYISAHQQEVADLERKWKAKMTEREKEWEVRMEEQKQMYETKLAASAGAERSVTEEQPTCPQSASLHVSAEPDDDTALLRSNHAAEITLLKQKIERIADENAALRKSKAQDPAVINQKVQDGKEREKLVSPVKRKADDEGGNGSGNGQEHKGREGSPKRVRTG
jgi:hypothetical protein